MTDGMILKPEVVAERALTGRTSSLAPAEEPHDLDSTQQPEEAGAQPGKIRVGIVDDHPIVRLGLRKLLELEGDIEVVGESENGRQALELVEDMHPDVLLLDLKMPGMDGLTVLQTLQHNPHQTRIIVFTASQDENEWGEAMKLGCLGIVVKETQPELIVKSIRKVHSGEIWLDSQATAALMRQQFAAARDTTSRGNRKGSRQHSLLSNRQREIVALVAQGNRNKEIAEKLFISEQTVKNHLQNIFDRVGVSDRLELALYAIHNGLLQAKPDPHAA